MVTKLSFENKTQAPMEITVEPEAVSLELKKGKSVEIKLDLRTDQYDDKFSCVIEENRISIYECRQYEMKIFVDNELLYHTPKGRYW